MHEHEIVRLAENVADRATGPDQSGDAGKQFDLEVVRGIGSLSLPERMMSGENSY
jgi:hypothetical protein